MTIDTVTNYCPYNMYQFYGYQYPIFKGTQIRQTDVTHQPVQAVSGVNLNIPPDTVSFSANRQIQNNGNDTGMSTGMKWLLGLAGTAATIYGCVVAHRAIKKPTIEKVTENLSSIFRRNVTKDEATAIVGKYRDIFKVQNYDEYCTKMFEQVKKDYGYGDINIPLKVIYPTGQQPVNGVINCGGWSATGGLKLYAKAPKDSIITQQEKRRIFHTYLHEFQHAKQSEMSYRANPSEYIKALKESYNKDNSKEKVIQRAKELLNDEAKLKAFAENNGETIEESRKTMEHIVKAEKDSSIKLDIDEYKEDVARQNLKEWFGKYSTIDKTSNDYEKAMKYIENERNYITAEENKTEYMKQLLEAEAYGVEPKGDEIIEHLASIWRLPFSK